MTDELKQGDRVEIIASEYARLIGFNGGETAKVLLDEKNGIVSIRTAAGRQFDAWMSVDANGDRTLRRAETIR